MKTLFTLLLATACTTSALAYDEGRLTITVVSKSNVQVMIDNRIYDGDDNTVVLNNIRPGQHSLQVYKVRRNSNVRNGNNRADLLYSSMIYVKPQFDVDVIINRFGKALVDEQSMNSRGRWDDRDMYGNGRSDRRNDAYGNSYNPAMSDTEFGSLRQRIQSQWFSSAKLNTAKDAVGRSYFSTQQVRQLLQLFSSDSDKLELAKLGYRNTVDQRSYYLLNDVFQFQSSREELERFVRDYRG